LVVFIRFTLIGVVIIVLAFGLCLALLIAFTGPVNTILALVVVGIIAFTPELQFADTSWPRDTLAPLSDESEDEDEGLSSTWQWQPLFKKSIAVCIIAMAFLILTVVKSINIPATLQESRAEANYWACIVLVGLAAYLLLAPGLSYVLSLCRASIERQVFRETDAVCSISFAMMSSSLRAFVKSYHPDDLSEAIRHARTCSEYLHVRARARSLPVAGVEREQFARKFRSSARATRAWQVELLMSPHLTRQELAQRASECAIALATLQFSFLPISDSEPIPVKLRILRAAKQGVALTLGFLPLAAVLLAGPLGVQIPHGMRDQILFGAIGLAAATVIATAAPAFSDRLALSRDLTNHFGLRPPSGPTGSG
jgi:hypothetical protein